MLDRLSPQVRHWVLMLVASLVTAGAVAVRDNLGTLLGNVPPAIAPILASFAVSLIGSVLLWATTLTGQYGKGAPVEPVADAAVPAEDAAPVDAAPVEAAPVADPETDAPAVGD